MVHAGAARAGIVGRRPDGVRFSLLGPHYVTMQDKESRQGKDCVRPESRVAASGGAHASNKRVDLACKTLRLLGQIAGGCQHLTR